MDKDIIKGKIKDSIVRLYNEDEQLFKSNVCERCLMFRLAHYLQLEFSEYSVDCEFNKMGIGENKKHLKVEPIDRGSGLKKMFADIIIHKRNTIKGNLVCIEIKHTKRHVDNDIKRLRMMTNPRGFFHDNVEYHYDYKWGFFIFLPNNKNRVQIRTFRCGNEAVPSENH